MEKLFISCPMRGRTEEQIRKSMEQMRKIAEAIFDEKFEVIDTWIADKAAVVSGQVHSDDVGSGRLYLGLR